MIKVSDILEVMIMIQYLAKWYCRMKKKPFSLIE